jgi:hypothetical protein
VKIPIGMLWAERMDGSPVSRSNVQIHNLFYKEVRRGSFHAHAIELLIISSIA